MHWVPAALWVVVGAATIVSCRGVLGIDDSSVSGSGGALADSGSSSDSSAGGTGAADTDAEAGLEAALDSDADAQPCSPNLGDDPAHCGECNHDCRGGDCVGGKCRPLLLKATVADYMLPVAGGQYVFVSSAPGPDVYRVDRLSGMVESAEVAGAETYGLHVFGSWVYLADFAGESVVRASTSGAFSPTQHVSAASLSNYSLSEVFVDDSGIYFPDSCLPGWGEKLWRSELDGSSPKVFATELPCLSDVEADASHVWALSADDATVYRLLKSTLPLDAGFAHTEVLSTDPAERGSALALTGSTVWVGLFGGGGGMYRFAKDGSGAPEQLAVDAKRVTHVTTTTDAVYWVDQGSQTSMEGTIGRVALTPGATPEVVATGLPAPIGLVVDDDVIYFTAHGAGGQSPGIYRLAL